MAYLNLILEIKEYELTLNKHVVVFSERHLHLKLILLEQSY